MGKRYARRRAASPLPAKSTEKSTQPSERAEVRGPDGRHLNDADAAGADGQEHDLRASEPATSRACMGIEFDPVTRKVTVGISEPADGKLRPSLIFFTGTGASTAVGYWSVQAYIAEHAAATLRQDAPAEGEHQSYTPEAGIGLAVAMFLGTLWLLRHTKSKS